VAIQTNICNLLGIPSSSTEDEIVEAYVEILQNELSGNALVPRDRFDEVYRTYQEWIDWKKQSLALVRVLQEESLKKRIVPRDEFDDFYRAYQEWNKLNKQDLSLVDSESKSPSVVIRLSATQALLGLISISAVVTSFLFGGGILISQRNRQVPIVITEEFINRPAPIVPNNQASASNNAPVAASPPTLTKPVKPIKQTTTAKPAPAVAKQKSATPTIPLSGETFSKSPALPGKVSSPAEKPMPTQTSPNIIGSKPEGLENSGTSTSTEKTRQSLQAIPIELESGSTIPASQLLKLNLSQNEPKAKKLSAFLKELAASQDVAQARLVSEIAIPQLQELAKEAKSLP
jgi:hypothetical protein